MTEQRVRELLGEVADAVPPPDLAERAWRKSVRVRRRRVAGAAVLAVGAIVAAVGVAGFINDGTGTVPRPDGDRRTDLVAEPPPAVALARSPDATVAGAKAWIGPTIEEEARLPYAGSVLPPTIDLAAEDIETTDQPGRAVAAFAASTASEPESLESVLLLGHDGQVSRLPTPDLGPVYNDKGESVLPLNISSLSPDGKRLVLAQDHAVVIYDLVSGDRIPRSTGESDSYYVGWAEDGAEIQLVEDRLDPDSGHVRDVDSTTGGSDAESGSRFRVETPQIWPPRTDASGRVAQTGYGPPISRLGDTLSEPVYVTVDGDRPALLVLPTDDIGHINPRSRVVAWFGDVVAFQSQDHGTYRVLSWDTSSGSVRRLSEADLPADWDDGVTASWADVSTTD
jgi:hypothetical protein